MRSKLINTLFTLGLLVFLKGYLSVGYVIRDDYSIRTTVNKQNTVLFGANVTDLHDKPSQRIILFLEDGARPDYLFGNTSYLNWKPFFQSLLEKDDKHTVCTEMEVDPPTSTTQGVKTLLTGGMPSFIELGQTFYSDILTSDHFLKQAKQSGLKFHCCILLM